MSSPIATFFSAWGSTNDDEITQLMSDAVAPDATYCDPNTAEVIIGAADIATYVGRFGASAPGWSAWVLDEQLQHGMTRATVGFGEGDKPMQYGQYFVETNGAGQLSRLVGFVGLYSPS